MAASFKCPNRGATVQVPEQLWRAVEQSRMTAQWKQYILIFLLGIIGLPTCLGLLGAIFGIGGSIFAAIMPFILRIFVH